jgi:hypothetical protein
MFHHFPASSVVNTQAICAHIARHFQPVSLSQIVAALEGHSPLPDNALAVTIDDGYRDFLRCGHPVFRKHRIPTTIYAVSEFVDGKLWLWFDKIKFALEHTPLDFLRVALDGSAFEFPLRSREERMAASATLMESLKTVSDVTRRQFVDGWAS